MPLYALRYWSNVILAIAAEGDCQMPLKSYAAVLDPESSRTAQEAYDLAWAEGEADQTPTLPSPFLGEGNRPGQKAGTVVNERCY